MTQEHKELLLKDLCARLPYGVRIFVSGDDFDNYQYPYLLTAISKFGQDIFCKIYSPIYTPLRCPNIENVKPYLFPLSIIPKKKLEELSEYIDVKNAYVAVELLSSHHIDYRGLIEKGLAIDATGLNIY